VTFIADENIPYEVIKRFRGEGVKMILGYMDIMGNKSCFQRVEKYEI